MNKSRLIYLLTALMLASCAKKDFTIEFLLAPGVDANYKVGYIDTGSDTYVELIAPVAAGKFRLQCAAEREAIVTVTPAGSGSPLAFLASPGEKITLTGDGENPFLWRVEGNETDRRWTQWRLENAPALEHAGPKSVNELITKYVKANPKDKLSLLLLLTGYDRMEDDAGFRSLWNMLDKELLTPGVIEAAARADLFETVTAKLPPVPKEFVARLGDDSLVTVRLADAKATLFWFRSDDNPGERDRIDSLRRYFRKLEAGRRQRLATVSFDADSTSMRRAVRFDSIPSELYLWEPMAEAGSLARKFSVSRVPCFVVVDSVGKVLYRGDKPAEALSRLKSMK